MKRYVQIMLIALVAQCGLSNVMYGMNKNEDPDFLVNDIKWHSDLTKADEDQYKLLWLGNIGNYGAFIAGAASTIGAGVGIYQKTGITQSPKATIGLGMETAQKPGMVQNIISENAPSWMTNPIILAGLGSLGAGYVSYKILYPRIRAGVISKVQKFIDYCETLKKDSAVSRNTILNWNFTNFQELKTYLPQRWSSASNKAVYNALSNLHSQAIVAKKLLEQVGIDAETQAMYDTLVNYIQTLGNNEGIYESVVAWGDQRKQQEEREAVAHEFQKQRQGAEIADLEARAHLQQQGARLAQATTAERYLQMTTDAIKNVWAGLNYIYKNKEKIVYRGTILGGALYGAYLTAKAKLGYGQ